MFSTSPREENGAIHRHPKAVTTPGRAAPHQKAAPDLEEKSIILWYRSPPILTQCGRFPSGPGFERMRAECGIREADDQGVRTIAHRYEGLVDTFV
jgi:hypothetical protein